MEPLISDIGWLSPLAIEAASRKRLSEGSFLVRNSEAFIAILGVGATAPKTIITLVIMFSSSVIRAATEATDRALASRRVNFLYDIPVLAGGKGI